MHDPFFFALPAPSDAPGMIYRDATGRFVPKFGVCQTLGVELPPLDVAEVAKVGRELHEKIRRAAQDGLDRLMARKAAEDLKWIRWVQGPLGSAENPIDVTPPGA